jgi:hypothetical protein
VIYLNNEFKIPSFILSPYAIFVIETKNYAGTIYGRRDRKNWSVNGKFPMVNPLNQNFGHIRAIQSVLHRVNASSIVSIVSFTRRCTFKVNIELRKSQSNELIDYDTELSEFITRKIIALRLQLNAPVYTDDEILQMYNLLNDTNITDKTIRVNHIKGINAKIKLEESKIAKTPVATCKTCGKEVSEKIRLFCLSNKERFKGEIYCFEHQK